MNANLDMVSQSLLNDFQHSFPLKSEPYQDLADKLNTDTEKVMSRAQTLLASGAISRIGPVFRPNTIGVSTLAAISVPTEQIEQYAAIVNQFSQVNHNYEREHEINLWFVLTAASQPELDDTIKQIERATGRMVLVLPMLKEYHIDLGFRMRHLNQNAAFSEASVLKQITTAQPLKAHELDTLKSLIIAIQDGLPIVERPYQALADSLEWTEEQVLDGLKTLIESGAIKRFGVVVRHHEMGYRANAMVVWDVQDKIVDQLGEQLGSEPCVTLCYRRPRVLPGWPYNLFCMIHGQNRDEVLDCIEKIRLQYVLGDIEYQVLFSGKRFKQRGAHYHADKRQVEKI